MALPIIQGRTGTALRDPGAFEGPLQQNDGVHAPDRQRPHLGPPLDSTHSLRIRTAGLSLVTLTLDRPPRGPSQEAEDASPGMDLRATALDSPWHPVATQGATGAAGNSAWENGHGPPKPQRPLKAPRGKMLGPTLLLASALTSSHTSARRTAGVSGLPDSWGLTLTLGLPLRGPSELAWRRNAGDWGTPSPCAGLNLPPRRHLRCKGRRQSFREGERAGPYEPPATFESPPRQNAGPTIPLPSALTMACISACRTASRSGLPASWGITLNLGQPLRGPSQGAWCPKAGDWVPPSPSVGLILPPRNHPGR